MVIRALKAIENSRISKVSEKQSILVQTVSMILERLLPSQTWDSRIEFLENSLSLRSDSNYNIDSSGVVLDSDTVKLQSIDRGHFEILQDGIPAADFIENLPEVENISVSHASVSEYAQEYLQNHSLDWQAYIRQSKQNRSWIMQEWISATEFWRKNVLKRHFQLLLQAYDGSRAIKLFQTKWRTKGIYSIIHKKLIKITELRVKELKFVLNLMRDNVVNEKKKVVQFQNRISLHRAMSKWIKVTVKKQTLDDSIRIWTRKRSKISKASVFSVWKETLVIKRRITALEKFCYAFRIRKSWYRWRSLQRLRHSLSRHLLNRALRQLIKSVNARYIERKRQMELIEFQSRISKIVIKQIFVLWRKLTFDFRGDDFRNQRIKKEKFVRWYERLKFIQLMSKLSNEPDKTLKRQMFETWLHQTKKIGQTTAFYLKQRLGFYFRIWRVVSKKSQLLRHLYYVSCKQKITRFFCSWSERTRVIKAKDLIANQIYCRRWFRIFQKQKYVSSLRRKAIAYFNSSSKKRIILYFKNFAELLAKAKSLKYGQCKVDLESLFCNWKIGSNRSQAEKQHRRNLSRVSFNLWRNTSRSHQSNSNICTLSNTVDSQNKLIMQRTLKVWRTLSLGKIFPAIAASRSLNTYFKLWRGPIQLDEDDLLFKIATRKHRKATLRYYWVELKVKFHILRSRKRKVAAVLIQIRKLIAFQLRNSANVESGDFSSPFRQIKLAELQNTEKQKKMIFRAWRRIAANLWKQHKDAITHATQALAFEFFCKWRAVVHNVIEARTVLNFNTLSRALKLWRSLFFELMQYRQSLNLKYSQIQKFPMFRGQRRVIYQSLYCLKLVKKAFCFWRNMASEKRFLLVLQCRPPQKRMFNLWKFRTVEWAVEKQLKSSVLEQSFQFWKLRTQTIIGIHERYSYKYDGKTLRNFLRLWNSKLLNHQAQNKERCRLNRLKIVLQAWRKKQNEIRIRMSIANRFRESKLKAVLFKRWKASIVAINYKKLSARKIKDYSVLYSTFSYWMLRFKKNTNDGEIAVQFCKIRLLAVNYKAWSLKFNFRKACNQFRKRNVFFFWEEQKHRRIELKKAIVQFRWKSAFTRWRDKINSKRLLKDKLFGLRSAVAQFQRFKRRLSFQGTNI